MAAIASAETNKFVLAHSPTGSCDCGESHDTRTEFQTDVDFALWFMPQSLRSPGIDQIVYSLMLQRWSLKNSPAIQAADAPRVGPVAHEGLLSSPEEIAAKAELKGIEFALRKFGITF